MNGYELLEKMELVDADLLQEAEIIPDPIHRPRYAWGLALAASLCVIVAGVWLVKNCMNLSTEPDSASSAVTAAPTLSSLAASTTSDSRTEDEIVYNPVTVRASAHRRIGPVFYEKMTTDELAALVPAALQAQMNVSGTAVYLEGGRLEALHLTFGNDTTLTAFDAANPPASDCVYLYEHVEDSRVGTLTVTAYSYDDDDYVRLEVTFQRGDVGYRLSASPAPDAVEAAKNRLQNIVAAYAADTAVPNLDAFAMREEHIWVEETLTREQAVSDDAFGRYMLSAAPQGYAFESARRHQDDRQNYLTALWSHGYDDLSWQVHTVTNSDRARLVAATDTRSYDLTLYPIPRAESVPEELWETVNNPVFRIDELTRAVVWRRAYTLDESDGSDDWRLHFSVLYGDTVVEIISNGVSPDWLYEQLLKIK